MYQMHATTTAFESACCNFCRNGDSVFYCDSIASVKKCFGVSGLNHKSYCILNKQYSKEEYEELFPRIVEHMGQATATAGQACEWGQFFPIEYSPFCYNETLAQDYFPLTKEEILEKGYKWKDPENFEDQGNYGQAKLNYITALNLDSLSTRAQIGLKRLDMLSQVK